MISPARTSTAFYLDDLLVDTVMLDYLAQQKHNGARLHKVRQSISKLRLVAEELHNGYDSPISENTLRAWVKEAHV